MYVCFSLLPGLASLASLTVRMCNACVCVCIVRVVHRWAWDQLRSDIAQYGVRNSLLVAPMPTASTSQILGNNECFEPYTSNIYVRRVLSGEFTVVNQHLLHDLNRLGLWNPHLKNELVRDTHTRYQACVASPPMQYHAMRSSGVAMWAADKCLAGTRRIGLYVRV